ncbi:MAG: tRNA (adenosine(37)-N6)-threonylcarbamoyltransferase complex ATPase subunit type 1 TsaE [Clostridia bacterium]|nr:tRNA (adenosine(37)-N6)-threonylcarbamoyltransferase complex ATPase subunit type 1 TsaE [Clostridia bacterium]
MVSVLSNSEKQTQRLGYCLGACLRAGDVVLLEGEMGAGKSVLTRAAARGMGVRGPVPSPTFTILNIHEGREIKLYHFDLYRLEGEDALYEMGLDEYIPAVDGASLIEWPQMAQEAMPQDALHIVLRYAQDGMAREIELEPMGAFDQARIDEIVKMTEENHEYPDD